MKKLDYKFLKKDFRLYLFIVIVFFVFVPLTILGSYINNSLSHSLERNMYQSNTETINQIENTISIYNEDMKRNMSTISEISAVKNLDRSKMQSILIENVKGNPFFKSIYVADKNGDIIYSTSEVYQNISDEQYFKNAVNEKSQQLQMKISESNGKPIEYNYAVPIKVSREIVGVLAADVDISIITQIPYNIAFSEVNNQNRLFTYVLLTAFILVLIFSYIFSERISRPLLVLSDTINKVSLGKLEANIDEGLTRREDQFGQLANKFNLMMKTIRNLSYYDDITELPNRRYFSSRLNREIKDKAFNKDLAIIFMDIDGFKHINDTWGHHIGDMLLKEVARRTELCINGKDIAAKIGGDEFVFIIYDEETVISKAEAILECIRKEILIEEQVLRITASLGIAVYPRNGTDETTLLRHADIAMYKAKENGGNSYQVFSEGMDDQLIKRNKLRNDLYKALEKEELILNYQPFVDVKTKEIIGMETLIRWNHPKLGLISPFTFIPIAEETGLIVPISEWILENACRQNKQWQEKGLQPVKISVNISAKHFVRGNFMEKLKEVLLCTGLEPHYLELEITEGIALKNIEYSVKLLKELRELGIEVALDDFGTGYSSLSYLTKFPFNTIKIDKSFIDKICQGESEDAIVSSIISIGHNLKLTITAEGVEHMEQYEFLKKYGCDKIQGYLFSRPVSAEAFEALLIQQFFK